MTLSGRLRHFGGEAKGDRDGKVTGDIERNARDQRDRTTPRTIVVSSQSIRLLSGSLQETIYIKR